MSKKLILLNGPAGIGKSTIARMYTDAHPLTLDIEGDQIMGMIGDWRNHELVARDLKLRHILSMLGIHLEEGQTVILPYLVTDATHSALFENVAKNLGADFYEIALMAEKDTAVKRLLARGSWGEAGSKVLTEEDIPRIEHLYDLMLLALEQRPNTIRVESVLDDSKETYQKFINCLN